MVINMLSFKSYFIHFIKSNRIALILLCLFSFIIITLPTMTLFNQSMEKINILFFTTFGYGFLLSIALPIFQFRFLFNKSATDTYFALPIKRNKLFLYEYFLGYLLLTIPLFIQFFISYIFFLFHNTFTPTITTIPPIYAVLLLVFITIQYTITTLFTVKSNNLFDALVFNLFELGAPIAFIFILNIFMQMQIDTVIGGNIGIYSTEVIDYSLILNILTLPASFLLFIKNISINIYCYIKFSNPINISYPFYIVCYWFIIGCICFFFAYRHFIKRNAESSQQPSTTLIGYPFLLTFTLLCLLLCIKLNSFIFLFIILIFCCYFILLSISKRKLFISIKHVLIFICFTLSSFGFQYAFQSTNGFHIIQEIPNLNQIQSIDIYIRTNFSPIDSSLYLFNHASHENLYGYQIQNISHSEYAYILQSQSNISKKAINNKSYMNEYELLNDSQYIVYFYYKMKNDTIIERYYHIPTSQKQMLQDVISTIQKKII